MKPLILFMACTVAFSVSGEPAGGSGTSALGADPLGDLALESLLATDPISVRRDYEKGMRLYDRGNYRDARPYLLTAAKNGYVQAQARVGGLYLYGYGVERNDMQGLAWLGVAARGDDPSIKDAFQSVWQNVPEARVSQVLAVIDDYARKYQRRSAASKLADNANNDDAANCVIARRAGTAIKKETCGVDQVNEEVLDEIRRETQYQDSIGTRRQELYEIDPVLRRHDQTLSPF